MLASLSGALAHLVARHGIYAVFALLAVDAVLPAASELVLLYAGALAGGAFGGTALTFAGFSLGGTAARFVAVALAGTLGYLLGCAGGWLLGRRASQVSARRAWWPDPGTFRRSQSWFARYGLWAVFVGRLTPVVRSFISIPAGAAAYPIRPYLLLSGAGSAIWAFGFAAVGLALGTGYARLHHAFRFADYAVVAALLIAAVAVVLLRRRSRRGAD